MQTVDPAVAAPCAEKASIAHGPKTSVALLKIVESTWARGVVLFFVCLLLYLPGQLALPPVDRDEARFVQTTRQMVDIGDYVDTRFQELPRYNKPIGVYWLQAAVVKLIGVSNEVWPYRVPSWLGATVATLLTATVAARLFGATTGALAGFFIASCLLVVVEARLAKADAVLLATTALAQSVLARLYLTRDLSRTSAMIFWSALGVGVLVKGPLILLVVVSTVVALAIADRSAEWLRPLRAPVGFLVLTAIVVPWLLAITNKSGGSFWHESVGRDLLAKIASTQESHGGPPGYYLFTVFIAYWPWSPLLLPAAWFAWRHRAEAPVRFCLAWIIPSWVIFELVPTKLPHYTLPMFPAIAALSGAAVVSGGWPVWMQRVVRWHAVFLLLAVGLVMAVAVSVLDRTLAPTVAIATSVSSGLLLAAWYIRRHYFQSAGILAISALVILYALYFSWALPRADALWLSREAVELIEKHRKPGEKLVSLGYTEPSLVFLAGTETVLIESPAATGGTRTLKGWSSGLILKDSTLEMPFDVTLEELGRARGINYSNGKVLEVVLLRFTEG